jgi:integrase
MPRRPKSAADSLPEPERKERIKGNGEGTVWKLADGRYRWQATLGYNGRKRLTKGGTAPNKKEANAALGQALTDSFRGVLAPAEAITFEEFAAKWLRRMRDVEPRTIRNYTVELGYALEVLDKKRMRDVKPSTVQDALVTLSERTMKGPRGKGESEKHMSPRTLAKVLTRIRSVFDAAVLEQIVYSNPARSVKTPKTRDTGDDGVSTVFDFHQAARFQEIGTALHQAGLCRVWPALFTALSLGLRRGEVAGLRWEDVDLEKNMLHIRNARTTHDGKVLQTKPKTKGSRRTLPIPASLKVILLEQQASQARERAACGSSYLDRGAVFTSGLGNWVHPAALASGLDAIILWSDPSLADNRLKYSRQLMLPEMRLKLEAAIRAGETLPDMRVHDLRHTFATLALRRGVPIEVVSKLLGHSRASFTLDTYRHVLESERRELALDLFDAPIPERPTRVQAMA